MPVIFLAALTLIALSLSGVVAAAEVSRAEVAADCRAEGRAMGITDSDLNDYVKECLEEFLGSSMVNHQSRSTGK